MHLEKNPAKWIVAAWAPLPPVQSNLILNKFFNIQEMLRQI